MDMGQLEQLDAVQIRVLGVLIEKEGFVAQISSAMLLVEYRHEQTDP